MAFIDEQTGGKALLCGETRGRIRFLTGEVPEKPGGVINAKVGRKN